VDLCGADEKIDPKFNDISLEISKRDRSRDIYHYIYEVNIEVKKSINSLLRLFIKQSEEKREETKSTKLKQEVNHRLRQYNYHHRLAHYLLVRQNYSFIDVCEDEPGLSFYEMHPSSIEKRRSAAEKFIHLAMENLLDNTSESFNNISFIQQSTTKMISSTLNETDISNMSEMVNHNFEQRMTWAKENETLFPPKSVSFLALNNNDRRRKLNCIKVMTDQAPKTTAPKPNNMSQLRMTILSFLTNYILKSKFLGNLFDLKETNTTCSLFGFTTQLTDNEKTLFRLMAYDYHRARLLDQSVKRAIFLLPETNLLIKDMVPKNFIWLSPTEKLTKYKSAYYEAHYSNMSRTEIEMYEKTLLQAVPLLIQRGEDSSQRYALHDRILVLKTLLKRCQLDIKHAKQSLQYPSLVLLKTIYSQTTNRQQKEFIFSKWNQFKPGHFKYITL